MHVAFNVSSLHRQGLLTAPIAKVHASHFSALKCKRIKSCPASHAPQAPSQPALLSALLSSSPCRQSGVRPTGRQPRMCGHAQKGSSGQPVKPILPEDAMRFFWSHV